MALRSNALCTVADFNADTGNSSTSTAERFINAASEAIERYLGRTLGYASALVETIPAYGTTRLLLSRTPLRSITSVVFDGATVDSTEYSIDDSEAGTLFRASGWTWTAGIASATQPYRLPGSEAPLAVVTYAGGYNLPADSSQTVPLPSDLSEAALELAKHFWRNRTKDLGVTAETVGNASRTYGDASGVSGIPKYILDRLAQYKRS